MNVVIGMFSHVFLGFNLYAGCGASVPVEELSRTTVTSEQRDFDNLTAYQIQKSFCRSLALAPNAPAAAAIAEQYLDSGFIHGFTNELVRVRDADANTPLHIACIKQYLGAAQLLADTTAPLWAKNNRGETPIYLCACNIATTQNVAWENLLRKLIRKRQLQQRN